MPSIKQLQYFCALAEDNNMSRLASKLYISQAALSNSISRLESELDAELFDRTPGALSSTNAASFTAFMRSLS